MIDPVIMSIMSKKPDHIFKAWLKDQQKKIRVPQSVKCAKKLIKLYKNIKNRGQKTFNFG